MSAKAERLLPFGLAALAAASAAAVIFTGEVISAPKALPAGTLTFGIVAAGFAAT